MIGKEEIMEYIENAPAKKVKQLAVTITAILNEKQLQALDTRFTKKIEFEPQEPKEQPKKEQEPDEKPSADKEADDVEDWEKLDLNM